MASVNCVTLLGRLGRDPKTSDAQGLTICRLALATTRRYKGRDGEKKEETEWHNVVVFGKTAEVAQQYLAKGSEVYIEGRLHTRQRLSASPCSWGHGLRGNLHLRHRNLQLLRQPSTLRRRVEISRGTPHLPLTRMSHFDGERMKVWQKS